MKNTFVLGMLVFLAGVAVGWYMFVSGPDDTMETGTVSPSPTVVQTQGMPVPGVTGVTETVVSTHSGTLEKVIVMYTDAGYTPKEITVKKGATVVFINDSGGDMWTASGPHPSHTNYPEFDQLATVAKGGTFAFSFDKAGRWGYHNHVDPSVTGVVVVTE